MKYLSDNYVSVLNYKGFDICTLKVAEPLNGDELNYVIDDEAFADMGFNHPEDAMKEIDNMIN